MRSRLFLLALLCVAGSLALPHLAHAGIPFFGPIIPPDASTCPLGWGAVINVINRIIELLLTLAIVFVAPIMIAYAGFLLVVNPFNPSGKAKAKSILLNTIVGVVIALAAWLIVAAIMAVLYNQNQQIPGGTTLGAWTDIIGSKGLPACLEQKGSEATPTGGTPPSGGSLTVAPTPAPTSPGTPATPGRGGVCSVARSGPCTPSNLQKGCFGSNANAAAQICLKESAGNPGILSASDSTADGNKYSVGLFQINITNSFSQKVNGKSCRAAFSAPCEGKAVIQSGTQAGRCSSTVIDKSLYDACVTAAQNPTINITEACRLSQNGSNWSPWRNTGLACGLIR